MYALFMYTVLDNKVLDNYITEDELWACTSCRACVQECPVSIHQLLRTCLDEDSVNWSNRARKKG